MQELYSTAMKCYKEVKRQHGWQGCSQREARGILVLQCHLVGIAASRCRPRTQREPKQEPFQPMKHSFTSSHAGQPQKTRVLRCFPAIETWHCNTETSDLKPSTGQEGLCTTQAPKTRQHFLLHHGHSAKIGAFLGRNVKHPENLIQDRNNFLLKAITLINFDCVKPVWLSPCLWER